MMKKTFTRRDLLRHSGSYMVSSTLLGDVHSPHEGEIILPKRNALVEKYPASQNNIKVSVEIDALVHGENLEEIINSLNPYGAIIRQIFITNRKSIEHTLESASIISKFLDQDYGDYSKVLVPHVTCRGISLDVFSQQVKRVRSEGYTHAFIVRGDSEGGNYVDAWDNPRDFPDTVFEYLKETSVEGIHYLCATHPELHPRSITIADEEQTMRDKISVGVKEFIGQSTLNAVGYKEGITTLNKIAPVRAYIYPITSNNVARDVARFSLSKISLHQERVIRKELPSDDQAKYWREETFNLVRTLLAAGIQDYHVTVVKNISKTLEIIDYLTAHQ